MAICKNKNGNLFDDGITFLAFSSNITLLSQRPFIACNWNWQAENM